MDKLRYLPFGEHTAPSAHASVPDELRDYCVDLYRETRKAYVAAGCPLGSSDEAMLVWFTFDYQASCRSRQIHCN